MNVIKQVGMCARSNAIKFAPINNVIKCDNWNKKRLIGKGAEGSVYQACCNRDCKYIVKVIPGNDESVQNEINFQQQFAALGLAIPVIEAFRCDDDESSYIIMAAKQVNVRALCTKLYSIQSIEVIGIIVKIVAHAASLLDQAHSNNLIHGDPHLENFMLDPPQNWDVVLDWIKGSFKFNKNFSKNDSDDSYVLVQTLSHACDFDSSQESEVISLIEKGFDSVLKELSRSGSSERWLNLNSMVMIDFGHSCKANKSEEGSSCDFTPTTDMTQFYEDVSEQAWGRYIV
jgi:serine/threonine protein kinase